jgi:hypothetical protein
MLTTNLKGRALGVCAIAGLAHAYYDGTNAAEQRVGPLITFPLSDKARKASMEAGFVNDNIVRHGRRDGWGTARSMSTARGLCRR